MDKYRDIDPMEVGAFRTSLVFRPQGMSSRAAYAEASGILTDATSTNKKKRKRARSRIRATQQAARGGDVAARAGMDIIQTARAAQKKRDQAKGFGVRATGRTGAATVTGQRHRGYLVTHEGRILSGEFAKTT